MQPGFYVDESPTLSGPSGPDSGTENCVLNGFSRFRADIAY